MVTLPDTTLSDEELVRRLRCLTVDYNGAPMVDGEPPLDDVRVRDLRDAADRLTALLRERDTCELTLRNSGNLSRLLTEDKVRLERERDTAIAERVELKLALERVKAAWEVLPEGRYPPREIAKWLIDTMAPAIGEARAALQKEKDKCTIET